MSRGAHGTGRGCVCVWGGGCAAAATHSLRLLNSLKICMRTKVLKMMVKCCVGGSLCSVNRPSGTSKMLWPSMRSTMMTISWYTEWPIMLNHIWRLIMALLRPYGARSSRRSCGGSVASASDAKESMMRLTHSICTGCSGERLSQMAPAEAMMMAAMLTVSWNWRNLATESYTLRPHLTADTMLEKSLVSSTMSEASLQISVLMSIAKPTSDLDSAGASLVPSPVTAITWRSL